MRTAHKHPFLLTVIENDLPRVISSGSTSLHHGHLPCLQPPLCPHALLPPTTVEGNRRPLGTLHRRSLLCLRPHLSAILVSISLCNNKGCRQRGDAAHGAEQT